MFSLQRRCMGPVGVLCCYFRPKMFSPGDRVRYHSRTLGAHVLATVVGRSPNGPQFCHTQYICPGGVTAVDHESTQLSRLEAAPQPRHTSHVFSLLASVEGTTVCLEIPLQPPPPRRPSLGDRLPPPPGRPSRANVGDCKGGRGVQDHHPIAFEKHLPHPGPSSIPRVPSPCGPRFGRCG